MSKISDKLNIISSAKDDIKTAIESKGVTVGNVGIQEYANIIREMEVETPIEKGVIVNELNTNGFPTDISIVGMTSIPNYYCSCNANGGHFRYVEKMELPDNLTSIGSNGFDNMKDLILTVLPSGITKIGSSAFYYCTNLKIKETPTGVTELTNQVFRYCSSLEELTCLGNITKIDTYALANCTKLAKLVFPNVTSVPTLSNVNALLSTLIRGGNGYVYFPDNLVEEAKAKTNWSTIATQIKGVSEL